MTPARQKLQNLMSVAENGRRLREFAEDPAISGWFDSIEKSLTEDVVKSAETASDTSLRSAAVALMTVRRLRQFMNTSVADADRAEKDLIKMNQSETHHV